MGAGPRPALWAGAGKAGEQRRGGSRQWGGRRPGAGLGAAREAAPQLLPRPPARPRSAGHTLSDVAAPREPMGLARGSLDPRGSTPSRMPRGGRSGPGRVPFPALAVSSARGARFPASPGPPVPAGREPLPTAPQAPRKVLQERRRRPSLPRPVRPGCVRASGASRPPLQLLSRAGDWDPPASSGQRRLPGGRRPRGLPRPRAGRGEGLLSWRVRAAS